MFRKVRDAVLADTGGRQEPFVYGSLSSRGVYLARAPAPAPVPPTGPVIVPDAAQATAEKFAAERELLFWESVKDSRHPADLQAYLDRYPDGAYEVLARNRLERLEGGLAEPEPPTPSAVPAPAPTPASTRVEAERLAVEREFWASVKASEDRTELQAYLDRYPDGEYAVLARNRLERLEGAASEPSVPTPAQPTAPTPVVLTPEELETSLGLERRERRMVQQGLASLGHAPGPADGLFGARTREAIRRYQGEKGFETTGYLAAEQSQALAALGEGAARAQARAEAERREAQRRAREQEARQRQEAARRADDAAFSSVKSRATVEAYGSYLKAYPSGRHVAEARRLRSEAERQEKAPGRRFRDCAECPELVVVPAGLYRMGSPSGEEGRLYDDEETVHRVRIAQPIAVGAYEVTFAEWDACRRGGGCTHNPNDFGGGRGTLPVIEVSWEDAQGYVRWLSRKTGERYRLLSESEWEYVARAGTVTRFWWGNAVGRGRASCNGCGGRWDETRAPVGSFSPNAFGVHDVHGNVFEWVEDCWHKTYAGAPSDGRAWLEGGGGNCSGRVLRGGSWYTKPRFLRSAARLWDRAGHRNSNIGFRVARTLD